MSRTKGSNPSPALVIALIALFVALGSGAYAASKIGTKDLKNEAVTGKKLAKNAVKSSKTKNGGLKGKDLKDETIGLKKLDSASVGKGFQPRDELLYATTLRGELLEVDGAYSRGARRVTKNGTGDYTVTFETGVGDCAFFPSQSGIPGSGTNLSEGVFLGVEPVGPQHFNDVRVKIWDQDNNPTDSDFSLLVVC